jgi:orotidine 5''-phosphate decarboxylase, subfamily 2
MTRQELIDLINRKKSYLCVGLDSDITKIPFHLMKEQDPVFEFNRRIIDATLPFAMAYKPNLAFYEAQGIKGLISLQKTIQYLAQRSSECFTIADAKRGDIGNTSIQYARSFFEKGGDFEVDALTVAPYMGEDSVTPFLSYKGRWVILLALTSNKGAQNFQFITDSQSTPLFKKVLTEAQKWGTKDNLMFVCGATQAQMFEKIRVLAPENFLLVPGVGAQGGSLEQVSKYGMTKDCGLIVNSSRGIIFASNDTDFASVAGKKAQQMSHEMARYLDLRH